MSTDGKLLTVSEFAAKAGCSTQRIYQLLQSTLQPFAIVENGRKYILSDGLPIVIEARKKQGFTKSNGADLPTIANPCQDLATDDPTDTQSGGAAELAALDVLRGVVEGHAAEIDRLRAALDEERRKREAAELTAARLTAERDAMHHRFRDASAERDRLAEIVSRLTTTIQADAAARAIAAKESTTTEAITDGEADPPKKKGFFKRLFSHKT